MQNKFVVIALLVSVAYSTHSSIYAQLYTRSTERSGKPFTITAEVRNEYDDNINTTTEFQQNAGIDKESSFKTIVRPSFLFNYPMDTTLFSARYTLGMVHYWERDGDDDQDFEHDFLARVAHSFTPRFEIDVRNRFQVSQRPEISGATGTGSVQTVRSDGDRFKNQVTADGSYQWTDRFSTVTGYGNIWYDYTDSNNEDEDRMRHEAHQDFQFAVLPTTTAIGSYRFIFSDYVNEVGIIDQDSERHIFTLGADHFLLPEWLISAAAGVEYQTFADSRFDDVVNPYAELSTKWEYDPRSYVELSYSHSSVESDNINFVAVEADQVGFEWRHYFTPKINIVNELTAIVTSGERERSNGVAEEDELVLSYHGAVEYEFYEWLSLTGGYRYTDVENDDNSARDYTRHQVYMGIRGTY